MSNKINKEDEIVSIKSSEIKPLNEKDKKCAPSKKFENGSCIPVNILAKMAQAYNEEHPNDKIKLSNTIETLNPVKYKRYLVKQFQNKMKNICNNQRCWLKQNFIERLNDKYKNELENDTFRPKGPQGKFTWLNTQDIDQVMEQYEKKYPEFKFLGAVPIDFDDLPFYGFKNLDFSELMKKGKTKLGTVFNLDRHDQSGSHWVAMFADLNKGTVYFSDSYGIKPDERILIFMRRIAKFIKEKLGKEPIVDYNRKRHQYSNYDCGTYSISFILKMAKGDSFEDYQKNRITDDSINQCRKYYFSN